MSKYQNYGNVKMKGKKEKVLSCGCCVAYNRKRFPTDADLEKNFRILEEGLRK